MGATTMIGDTAEHHEALLHNHRTQVRVRAKPNNTTVTM